MANSKKRKSTTQQSIGSAASVPPTTVRPGVAREILNAVVHNYASTLGKPVRVVGAPTHVISYAASDVQYVHILTLNADVASRVLALNVGNPQLLERIIRQIKHSVMRKHNIKSSQRKRGYNGVMNF